METEVGRFSGMDQSQIKQMLVLMNGVVFGHFKDYDEFVAFIERGGLTFLPRDILACARQREKTFVTTYAYRYYGAQTGDMGLFFDYLVRHHHLETIKKYFPEQVTPKLLRSFARHWLARAKEEHNKWPLYTAYEVLCEVHDKPAMARVRKLAIEFGDVKFFSHYRIVLRQEEGEALVRSCFRVGIPDPDDLAIFLMVNGLKRHYRLFLNEVSRKQGFGQCMHFSRKLHVRPSSRLLAAMLDDSLTKRDGYDAFGICEELHRRNPRKWQGKLRELAAEDRGKWLKLGEPEEAYKMAVICGQPLTWNELVDIYSRFEKDDRPVMREKAEQALDMAAALIARQTGAPGPKKAKAA